MAYRDAALRRRFGRALREARDAAGVSQEELAARSGFSVSYVSLVENGHNGPSLEAIVAFAAALKIRAHTLVEAVERSR